MPKNIPPRKIDAPPARPTLLGAAGLAALVTAPLAVIILIADLLI